MVINKQYDVIVVGAGNGGLSAAAYLAKAGKNVLVLEKNNVPGGCATSFVRGRFEFEASLHQLCRMGEGESAGAARKLLDEYGLDAEWIPIGEAFRSINLSEDREKRFDASMPAGVLAFTAELEHLVPGSRRSIETVMELSRMIADGVKWLESKDNDPRGLDKLVLVIKYRDLMKAASVSCDEMLRKVGVPDKAREIYESYWDFLGVDAENMSFAVYAFMTYSYLTQKPYISRLRSHEISLAFDKMIRENGGDIWYNTPVASIGIENGAVTGVTLSDGTRIPCERVISNLMPETVFGLMTDPEQVPAREKKLMNARTLAQSAFTVYLALDIPCKELGFKGYDTFVRHDGDTAKQLENASSIETHKDYCVTVLNEAIPGCSPEGTCLVQFTKMYPEDPFSGVTEEEYFALKDRIARETIEHFEKLTGKNIRNHIEEIVIASPATWARYLGTPRGDVYGYMGKGRDNMFARVRSGKSLDHTVRGLRFCGGHGTQLDGYSQAYLSGREQARYTLDDMEKNI